MSRVGLCDFAGDDIFGLDVDRDFDRGVTRPSDPGVTAKELSNLDRGVKLHRVDIDRHAGATGVAHGADGAGFVNGLHYYAAVDSAQLIGVFRQHQLLQRDCRFLGISTCGLWHRGILPDVSACVLRCAH